MKEKNIGLSIFLTIITCGIYGIYWFVSLTDDVNNYTKDNNFSGGKALLLVIVTCGIYMIFWNYKMGQEIYAVQQSKKIVDKDNSILYLILGIFGFSIINFCIMQDSMNNIINNGK